VPAGSWTESVDVHEPLHQLHAMCIEYAQLALSPTLHDPRFEITPACGCKSTYTLSFYSKLRESKWNIETLKGKVRS